MKNKRPIRTVGDQVPADLIEWVARTIALKLLEERKEESPVDYTYPTKWKVSKNMDIYQVWRQIRALHPGEPMNSAVREYFPDADFITKEEAAEFARKLNSAG